MQGRNENENENAFLVDKNYCLFVCLFVCFFFAFLLFLDKTVDVGESAEGGGLVKYGCVWIRNALA